MNASIDNRRFGGRAVYTAVLLLSTLSLLSYLGHWRRDAVSSRLADRSIDGPRVECRMVHQFPDKCTFVQANCADEDAGLISYLQLYFCSLRHVQPIAFAILVIWIVLLFSTIGIAASDFLCINLSTIASILGMSESLTGVTFLAFGNGSPDVFSTFAAMSSHSGSLAVGELIGAASFITAVVAGSMAIVRPFEVARKSFFRDVGFFVVAACFSMVFLADGRLQVWECACMVAFYLFYVIFVVTWHWWFTRRRRRRLRETAAKLHHYLPRTPELHLAEDQGEAHEEYSATETTALLQGAAEDDLSNVESNVRPVWKTHNLDEDEEGSDRQLANIRSNMRLIRPARGERRNAINPLRPSLVGALEFRSVLHSLEKQSNQARQIYLRRYSDEPTSIFPQFGGNVYASQSVGSKSQQHSPHIGLHDHHNVNRRARAVSAHGALDLGLIGGDARVRDSMLAPASETGASQQRDHLHSLRTSGLVPVLGSPKLFLSPSETSQGSREHSPASQARSPDHLAPPDASLFGPRLGEQRQSLSPNINPTLSVHEYAANPNGAVQSSPPSKIPSHVGSPSCASIEDSRPPSILLPPPSLSPESSRALSIVGEQYEDEGNDEEGQLRKFKWWPYRYLPPPQVLGRTLLPTVYTWRGKSMWDRVLGIVAVPSVLLLTITLPVVETEEQQESLQNLSGLLTPRDDAQSGADTIAPLVSDSSDLAAQRSFPDAPAHAQKPHPSHADSVTNPCKPKEQGSEPREWTRWLFCLQLFTAPLFTVAISWANVDIDHEFKSLVWYLLCSILCSLICLFILLATTAPDRPPRYRPLFCFVGFAVAIAWISTIANEVVGVLKAFGVILGISDAILGLTIFAVGNSLGDLVADTTVARLGFPVMALSACFGGPMLNILLGIGVSGMYITIRHGAKSHRHHPDVPIKYHPYHIHVSTTLLISGITLLVTLVGLLIAVPLNRWKMDRKIGVGLIALWTLSTIGNVVVEVLGWGPHLGVS